MFELRRERAVACHGGPAVRQYLDLRTPEIDHRLDREEHAGAQRNALAFLAVMQNIRKIWFGPAVWSVAAVELLPLSLIWIKRLPDVSAVVA